MVNWEYVLKVLNSGVLSVFVEADIFISVTYTGRIACIFNMVAVCGYIFICFYIGFTRSNNLLPIPYCAAFKCKIRSAKYSELSFFISSGKQTVVKQ